ncbi:MAG: AAA family ATPase [Lachnospiraceae bacterium]|nr:AAA family ATPase [Lachnospiraceae bacterium]
MVLDANNRLTTFIKPLIDEKTLESLKRDYPLSEFVNLDDSDDSYDFMFENGNGVDIETSRIHLSNLLLEKISKQPNNIPVVTFYSYKGGVGRSTTLASLASYLAIKKNKKVIVFDCDFEAPGFTNFFLEDPENIYYKNGLIEFFMDSVEGHEDSLSAYYWETSKKFSGQGSIYIFPSGNLSTETIGDSSYTTHLNHYLNGLSRLDMFNQDSLVERFRVLISKIEKEIKPDVILIDSRTGFNDIFGISAYRLSDIVVGFFGIDAQTRPGLTFFLESLNKENAPRIILVNSIIPSFVKSKLFASFKEYVEEAIRNLQSEDDEERNGIFEIKTFAIGYSDVLKNIGLPTSNYEDYISFIENNEFVDYVNLFNYIEESVNDTNVLTKDRCKVHPIKDTDKDRIAAEPQSYIYKLKKKLLGNISENLPELYAESITDYEQEFLSNRYFYRKCMEDLFNIDKFLVLGNKGTGKTYIYRSLANQHIVDELRKRANKEDYEYEFIPIINSEHRFDTLLLDNQIGDFPLDLFFERFWKVYIWDVLMGTQKNVVQPSFDTFDIKSDTATAKTFVSYIKNDDKIINIEKDLNLLDKVTKQIANGRKRIIFIFDELDSVVSPYLWTDRISPLINYCRGLRYACISPKLFLRSDLYKSTFNINNRNELNNRTINIEWQKDEMFAYFFKFILSHSKEEFFELMKLYEFYPNSYVNKTICTLEKNNYQPLVEEYSLRHLCATFFGKYADSKQSNRYGESYDWFFNNLKNADETISLRPFIDLIRYAVKDAKEDKLEKPILPATYFTNSQVRVNAVKKHFDDLSQEKGNTDLKVIFDYIRDKAERKFKKDRLTIEQFDTLANKIIQQCKLSDVMDADMMLNLLLDNGIVREQYIRFSYGAQKCVQFALLYKYYLGLGSRQRR